MLRALAAWTLVWSAIVCAPAEAEKIGPPPPLPVSSPEAGRFRDATASLRTQVPEVPVPHLTPELGEEETIEGVSGEERGPRVPEPMVFDLVRPLGAKHGEWEANTLALFPFRPRSRRADDMPDPLGLVRRSRDRWGIEWAPELPMEDAALEAFKVGGKRRSGPRSATASSMARRRSSSTTAIRPCGRPRCPIWRDGVWTTRGASSAWPAPAGKWRAPERRGGPNG